MHIYMKSVQAMLDPFERTNGNGSSSKSDDWLDGESIYDNEWGSQAATTFRPSEVTDTPLSERKRRRLERLYARQNGKGNPDRPNQIQASYIGNDTEMFISVLELPERQRETVREILDNLDLSSNNFGPVQYEKIILTVCSLVADEALSNRNNPSLDERLFLSDRYRELMDAVGMSSTDHRKLRPAVRERSDYF